MVPRRLLEALADHVIKRAIMSVEKNSTNAEWATRYVLMDAAEAKLLIERQDGKR